MAELEDAHGSGPCGSNTMRVQVPPPAVIKQPVSTEGDRLFAFAEVYLDGFPVYLFNGGGLLGQRSDGIRDEKTEWERTGFWMWLAAKERQDWKK